MKPTDKIQTGILAENPANWKQKMARWVRLNLFIPDAKIGWFPFAVRTGQKIIMMEKPDIIFSSSPPPTVHLIARSLAKKNNLKWVADFRDPWTEINYYDESARSSMGRQLDRRLEDKVLNSADRVMLISKLDADYYFADRVDKERRIYLPNGYDEEDFTHLRQPDNPDEQFTLMHLGAVNRERNPRNLFQAIRELAEEKIISPETFKLVFVGLVERPVQDEISRQGIKDYVDFIKYVPHRKALEMGLAASALLLLINQSPNSKRIVTGKIFEYMRLGKYILAFGQRDGEVAGLLDEFGNGRIVDYGSTDEIRKTLMTILKNWQEEKPAPGTNDFRITGFNRHELTRNLATIFADLIQEGKSH
ncbi:MAG: glycosyltransferase [Calditrichia bacterium]